jgi:transposase
VGEKGRTVAAVARDLGVGWHAVMETVREFGAPLIDALSLAGVSALGMDEHRWRHHPRGWAIGFCDLDTGRLIDIIEGRSGSGISRYLAAQPAEIRARIETVSVDPWRGYLRPVRRLLPGAQVVVDHFHLIRLANQVVTEVRQRTQQAVTGHRGRKGDPLYGIRHLLLRGRERLTDFQRERVAKALDHPDGDRWDEIASAWIGKELLRDVYAADGLVEAAQVLAGFYQWVEEVEIPELSRLARTVHQWETEILAYHLRRYSNAKTETANLIVEKQRRGAHGYRNFTNYRLRLLLNHGVKWDTQATTKIRGRKPPLVA